MYKKSYELLVGIFVILGIMALAFITLKISSLELSNLKTRTYQIHVQFQNIGSLRPGSAVRIAGVEIGRVSKIALESSYNGFVADVTLSIDEHYDKIPSTYGASIATSGILGDSFIALEPSVLSDSTASSDQYLKDGSIISLSQTSSAVNLNSLINTFIGNKSGGTHV